MAHLVITLAVTGAIGAGTFVPPVLAQKHAAPAETGRPNACGILPREEVKKIVPWGSAFDRQKETEEPYGTGSLCSYPGVSIWVGKFSQSRLTFAAKQGPLTSIPGIGDEAFLNATGSTFVELYIKLGDRMVHVQKGIPFTETFESLKPGVLALGKALAAKLSAPSGR